MFAAPHRRLNLARAALPPNPEAVRLVRNLLGPAGASSMTERLDGLDGSRHDLCIVGAGPVGLTLALEWSRRGRRVLVLESGGRRPIPRRPPCRRPRSSIRPATTP